VEITTDNMLRQDVKPNEEIINSYEEFEKLACEGHEDYRVEITLSNGQVKSTDYPFECDDLLTYIFAKHMFFIPGTRLYKVTLPG
jgi:hypothetical protein